ncbi:hypothetical protein GQX73_g7901 [Xylaria multiplex]|uniref:DUF6604 domain-containing protein n=1 Tax=Xylaria multiplex TaxID=323545 RepID=A0A7C8N3G7_9PEZI|nr:hypothetical protein GQX73_g7901 [Xylaria multiplex]
MDSLSTTALYPQYKKDTKTVAQWLDVTSKDHGFVISRDQRPRAEAKKHYIICIADFGLMAEFLSRKPQVSIPPYILNSLSRAIRYRTTYGSYLQAQRQDETEDKNHLFFIDVLRGVQSSLNRIPKPSDPVAAMAQTAPPANKFASLYVPQSVTMEDDVEDHTPTPNPIPTEALKMSLKDDVTFEPSQEDFEEALFQWRLFSIDVQRIRTEIRQLWEMYRTGHIGLVGVSTAHNMSIHLVRELEQDVLPIFKKWGGCCGAAANDKEIKTRLDCFRTKEGEWTMPPDDVIIDNFDIAEEEMVHAWHILYNEAWSWGKCGRKLGCCHGKWGQFTPSDDRQNKTSCEKYSQDKAMACKALHDIYIHAKYLNTPIDRDLDELSKAIADIIPPTRRDLVNHKLKPSLRRNEANFRAVFAVQLFLDSVNVLGTNIDQPCGELKDKNARICKSTKGLHEFYEGRGAAALGPNLLAFYAECVTTSVELRQGISSSQLTPYGCSMMANWVMPPTEEICSMLRHNPPFSGWWMQTIQTFNYNYSIFIAQSIGLLLNCARLYSVFLQESLVPKASWPDMDAFMTLHRGDVWVGTTPKPGQYLKNLIISEGETLVGFANNPRFSSERPRSYPPAKCITRGAKVSRSINQAFITRKAEGLTRDDAERLISGTKLRWYEGKPVKPCFHHGWEKAGNHKGDANPASSKTDNLFLRLALAVDAEDIEQSFDYMSFHRVCWLVLQDLIKRGRPILETIASLDLGDTMDWKLIEGEKARNIVRFIFMQLFREDGTVRQKEASAIADIFLSTTRNLGRVVHTSTGIDWEQALKCTCDDIPSPNGSSSR